MFDFSYLVGAGYVTTRGCAPFDTETFGKDLQRGMAGTYWKAYDAFSLCENPLCNSTPSITSSSLILNMIVVFLYAIYLY